MASTDNFKLLLKKLNAYPHSMPADILYGYLTGVACSLDSIEQHPWKQKILGMADFVDENQIPEVIDNLIHELLEHLVNELSSETYEPVVTQQEYESTLLPNTHLWAQGFLQTVIMLEQEWEYLTDIEPDLGQQLIALNMLADHEKYAPIFFKEEVDIQSSEFLQDIRSMAGPLAISMFHLIQACGMLPDDDIETLIRNNEQTLSAEVLREMPDDNLLSFIVTMGDTLPRSVVEVSAERESSMLPLISDLLSQSRTWQTTDNFAWWAPLHCIFILGKMQSAEAAAQLVNVLKQPRTHQLADLWDWVAGYWPSLFENKIADARDALTELVNNSDINLYRRYDALECLLFYAQTQSQQALNETIDKTAQLIETIDITDDARYLFANLLLDFPRQRHKPQLEKMVQQQKQYGDGTKHFDIETIETAYIRGDDPEWLRFSDPWKFYNPNEIIGRQYRWQQEEIDFDPYTLNDDYVTDTYIRETPKVGRNDPCPCGSGKKYKKCCLH